MAYCKATHPVATPQRAAEVITAGRKDNGSEWSSRRSIHRALKAKKAAKQFLEQSSPQVRLAGEGDGLELLLAEPNWRQL